MIAQNKVLHPGRGLPLLSVVFAGLWWLWAVDLSIGSYPGLLDDGSHIFMARFFGEQGFFSTLMHQLGQVWDGSRFYEIHYGLIGAYYWLFGQNLDLWYLGQFSLCFLSALLLGITVYHLTQSRLLGHFGFLMTLTSSAVAETVRGNFGKSEPEMVFFLALSFFLLFRTFQKPDKLILAAIFFVFAVLSKESGKAFCGGLGIIGTLIFFKNGNEKVRLSAGYFLVSIVGYVAILAASTPSSQSAYLNQYFSLNLDSVHILDSFFFYLEQTPDLIVILAILFLLIPTALTTFFRNSIVDLPIVVGIAMTAVTFVYFLMLLTFKFQNGYYTYVPTFSAILAVCCLLSSLKKAETGRAVSFLLLSAIALLSLSRLHTIPYNISVGRAQKVFDSVNYALVEKTEKSQSAHIFLMDVAEDSQLVQEWNYLRIDWMKGRIPIAFGAAAGFYATEYQMYVSQLDRDKIPDWKALTEQFMNSSKIRISPKAGDLIAIRTAKMQTGTVIIRSVLPMEHNASILPIFFDTAALKTVFTISDRISLISPFFFKSEPATYGWELFLVNENPRYFWTSIYSDQWLKGDSTIQINGILDVSIRISVPALTPRRKLMFSAFDGLISLGQIEIESGEIRELHFRTKKSGPIQIRSSGVFIPGELNKENLDSRALSGRVVGLEIK